MTDKNADRMHLEVSYTFPREVAQITVGLAQQSKRMDHPVHLFNTDGGILAAVSVQAESLTFTEAVEIALDLVEEEIDTYLPSDVEEYDDPWCILIVDHDGMANNLRNTQILPILAKATPAEPVESNEGDEGGTPTAVGGGK